MYFHSCLTLCSPVDCNLSGSSVHGIFQASILEWVAISYSRGSSWPKDWNFISFISCICRPILYRCTIWEPERTCFKYSHWLYNKVTFLNLKKGSLTSESNPVSINWSYTDWLLIYLINFSYLFLFQQFAIVTCLVFHFLYWSVSFLKLGIISYSSLYPL